jgi:hypothetical protein
MTLISIRRLVFAVTIAAASAVIASAETPKAVTNLDPVCPVQLSQLSILDNKLIFRNKNTSGVYIKKIALGAAYFDSAHVQHPIEIEGGWKDLHAGLVLDSALDIKRYRQTGYAGWTIWPEKVLFSDGSLWQIDHATTSCGLQAWKTNQTVNAPNTVQASNSDLAAGGN